jgi:O-antigen/teichoic acid export membrane protein
LNQLKTGAVLSYVTIIVTTITGILVTPYIIDKLGKEEYGLWTLIGALIGYISVLDFGLNNAIVRFVAKYRAEKDKRGEENFLAVTFIIYGAISLVVTLIGIIIYFNLETLFDGSLTPPELAKAKTMFSILIFNVAISLPGGGLTGIASGYEKFIFPRFANILKYVLRTILVVMLLYMGGDAIGIVVLDTLLNMLIVVINAIYIFKCLKVKIVLFNFDRALVKNIINYSFWIFIFAIVIQFQWKVGQMVLGIVSGTTAVAVYAVGVMLGTYYGAFSSAISGVFLPRATKMIVEKATGDDLTAMMVKVGRLSLIVLMYILIAFGLFGKQFVLLWVGQDFIESFYISFYIMLVLTISLVQAFGNSVLEAKNKYSFKAILYLIVTIIGTGIGALFAKEYGATGMVMGTIISLFVVQNIMNVYYHKYMGINMFRFYRELIHKILLCGVGILIFAAALVFIPGFSWYNFVLKAVLYSIIYVKMGYASH